MKLTSRKKLLEEADIELKKISESVSRRTSLTEDSDYYELDARVRSLLQLAKKIERMNKTNESSKSKKKNDSWRNKPVTSKWALKNLPPTNDPIKLKERERMKKWEELNERLIDSWWDYMTAGPVTGEFENIVVKDIKGDLQGEVYDAETLEPIPSVKYPGKTMRLTEWSQLYEQKKKSARKGIKGFILDLLEELSFSMMP